MAEASDAPAVLRDMSSKQQSTVFINKEMNRGRETESWGAPSGRGPGQFRNGLREEQDSGSAEISRHVGGRGGRGSPGHKPEVQ